MKQLMTASPVSAPAVISTVLLLMAIPESLPYDYYIFLRWVITATSIYVAWISYELEEHSWTWAFSVVALLFNPISPIHLDKGIWVMIDFVVAILFIAAIVYVKEHRSS